jgi:hypothetical protein
MTQQDFINYFQSLGYKSVDKYFRLVVEDFQRHAGIKSDGIIGPVTKDRIEYYNKDNYCPEVFEPVLGNRENVGCCKLEKFILTLRLSGLSWVFMESQEEYGVNILHNIAHAVLESASGTSFIARMKNNLYGFMAYDSSPYASAGKFKDYPDCIDTWTGWLAENYLFEDGKYYNGNSEYGINVRYATSPVAGINKAFIVKDFRKKLND